MSIKDLSAAINQNIEYKNFAEEVTIVTETNTGSNYSLYTVTNKNGVTFQNVPGPAAIKNLAHLGFINGDRGRPVIFGAGTKVNNTKSTVSDPGWPVADVLATTYWDIQLHVISAFGNDTETKTAYIGIL